MFPSFLFKMTLQGWVTWTTLISDNLGHLPFPDPYQLVGELESALPSAPQALAVGADITLYPWPAWCPTVIHSRHQNVRRRWSWQDSPCCAVGWNDYCPGNLFHRQQCVDLIENFSQTESYITEWQFLKHWANFHLFTSILEASIRALDFVSQQCWT